jgi:CCR4-NOT transcription complex subunit 3
MVQQLLVPSAFPKHLITVTLPHRYRITSGDIKDKQPLIDARKSVERDMERFKVCEKESKAKGFGGSGGSKTIDPKEAAKEGARDWINNTVESLTSKVG